MSGDYGPGNRIIDWRNTVQTQGEEIIFPGVTSAYISAPDSNDWNFDDFTIELFGVKVDSATILHAFCGHYLSGSNQRSFAFAWNGAASPKQFELLFSTTGGSGPTQLDYDFDLTAGVAYDICFERSGSDVRVYVDGTMVIGAQTFAGTLFNSTQLLTFGQYNSSQDWLGRVKAIRVTRIARYASDGGYIVPTLPLPTQGP